MIGDLGAPPFEDTTYEPDPFARRRSLLARNGLLDGDESVLGQRLGMLSTRTADNTAGASRLGVNPLEERRREVSREKGPFAIPKGTFAVEPGTFSVPKGTFGVAPGTFAVEPGTFKPGGPW